MFAKRFIIVFIFCILGISINLSAEIFGNALGMKKGRAMLGVAPQFTTSPSEFQINMHTEYAVLSRLDLGARVAGGTDEMYLGGYLKYLVERIKKYYFSVSGGMHHQNKTFLDFTPMVSYRFRQFIGSSGLDFNYLTDNGGKLGINCFLGASFNYKKNVKLHFDMGLELNSYYNWVSGGVAYYF